MKKLILVYIVLTLGLNNSFGQWQTTGLNNGSGASFGTNNNFPINIFTNNTNTARFITPNSPSLGLNAAVGGHRGLTIFDASGTTATAGRIDIFTSNSNSTEIRFGGSGNIAGRLNRFEMHGNYNGLYFNGTTTGALGALGVIKFARAGTLYGGLTQANKWLFGAMTDNPLSMLSAVRRVHVFDVDPQLRLSFGGQDAVNGVFTDFQTNNSGNLQIMPSGQRVAVNLNANPTHNLDVNGNMRIRNVPVATANCILVGTNQPGGAASDNQVSRLDFTGNATQVLLGNGTWGAIPPSSSFGICGSPIPTLTGNSALNLNDASLYFLNGASPSTLNNSIGLGHACGTVMQGKFDVLNSMQNSGIRVQSNFTGLGVGTRAGVTVRTFGAGTGYGISTIAQDGATQSVGIRALGVNSLLSIGVDGFATQPFIDGQTFGGRFNANSPSNYSNVGVYGFAGGGNKTDVGGYFEAIAGGSSSISIGVYGRSNAPLALNYAGFFAGNVVTNGAPISLSDSTLKDNIQNENDLLNSILRLRPVNYTMRSIENPELNLAEELQHGFIAQEIEVDFPELVLEVRHPARYDTLGVEIYPEKSFKGLNYNGLISLNTGAIQELNQKVENISLSDESIKTNVVDLTNSLDKILDMRGVSFDWTSSAQAELNLENSSQIGFIAQEIQAVDPRLTFIGTDSLLHVKYEKVVPILVESIQELNETVEEQQETIDDLNNRLTDLENCLSGILPFLCQLNNSAIQTTEEGMQEKLRAIIDVQLSDKNSIVLNQNVPNPFAESTVITYSVPAAVQRAQIHFYDMNGILINSVDISDRGEGQINVYANDLSSGIYSYSLVADGKVVSTKKMMKQ